MRQQAADHGRSAPSAVSLLRRAALSLGGYGYALGSGAAVPHANQNGLALPESSAVAGTRWVTSPAPDPHDVALEQAVAARQRAPVGQRTRLRRRPWAAA